MPDVVVDFFRKNPKALYVFSALSVGCALYCGYYALRTHMAVERAVSELQAQISEDLGG